MSLKKLLATEQGRTDFMRDLREQFTLFAEENYVAFGRGSIVIELDKIRGGHFQPIYFSVSEMNRLQLGWPSDELREQIETYDPDTQFVIQFVRPDKAGTGTWNNIYTIKRAGE